MRRRETGGADSIIKIAEKISMAGNDVAFAQPRLKRSISGSDTRALPLVSTADYRVFYTCAFSVLVYSIF